MTILWRKELQAYFRTPFGFVFIGIYLILSGIMFSLFNLLGGSSSMAGMFDLLKNLTFIIYPLLTMKMFAEERQNGTEAFLMTSKLSAFEIVVGKYLAACTLFLIALCITFVYVIIVAIYGVIDFPSIMVSYIGFFLLSVSMIAICTFVATFAETQMTSAIAAFGVLFVLTMLLSLSKSIHIPGLTQILSALAITKYYDEFTLGVLSFGPIVYYLGVTLICMMLAVKNIEYRKFR